MNQASDSQQAMEDHPSVDWTGQLIRWPYTNQSIEALQRLPRVRELTLRPGRAGLNFNLIKNQQAALGQICGDLALAACRRCAEGKGPFVECVAVQGRFSRSCCNCHYSSQGLRCSFREIELPAPNTLRATNDSLDAHARPAQVACSESEPSAVLARPHGPQSNNEYITTPLRPNRDALRKRPRSSGDPAIPPTSADPTTSTPLKRKRQFQEATTTSHTLEQSQLEKGTDAVLQMSEEPIQSFREEIQRLKREKSDQEARQSALIKGFVTFAAVLEMAVDVREAELRYGLTHMTGISEDMQEQAQRMMAFSNATSWHVNRLVKSMLDGQQLFLDDRQLKSMWRDYERAQPSQALAAIINEELPSITKHIT